jgi:L-fuconolactonase
MSALKRDFLPEDLAAECDANGVSATVAVQADQSEDETTFLLDLAEDNERIAGVVGWLDLCAPDVEERLRSFCEAKKLRGLRHVAQSEPDDRFLVRADFLRGMAQLRYFSLTYDILIYPRQLSAAIDLVARSPEQPFVLDHLAKPEIKSGGFEAWATQIRELAQAQGVYCKLSGLVTEADWKNWTAGDFARCLDAVFDAFSPERLMFGSDWPVCLLAASYRQVKQIIEDYVAANAPQHRDMVFGGNAMRFYGLRATAHGSAA